MQNLIMHLRSVFFARGLVIGATLLLSSIVGYAQVLAFPGAEGWAATTSGGRGGSIIKVTNLNSEGEGSLRAALETAGRRTVVFDVGGVIDLEGIDLVITQPLLTVAGQSAPSPGITIIDGGIIVEETNNVVIRHIRVRPGAARRINGITVNNSQFVIIDHCSISWAVHYNLALTGSLFDGESPEEWRSNTSSQITFSNNLLAEGLFVGKSSATSRGSIFYDNTSDIALLKNLYTQSSSATPKFKAGVRAVVMNNILYNPGTEVMQYIALQSEWSDALMVSPQPPEAQVSLVGNILDSGPNFASEDPLALYAIHDEFASLPALAESTFLRLFVEDNLRLDSTGTPNELIPEVVVTEGKEVSAYLSEEKPIWNETFLQITTDELAEYMLSNVGARPWETDPVDERILLDWQNRTGSIIESEAEVGGFPDIPSTERPDDWDVDNDGMPDNWEKLKGLVTTLNDGNRKDLDPGRYTNLEVYLNEMAAFDPSASPKLSITPFSPSLSLISEDFSTGTTAEISIHLNASRKPVWNQNIDGFPNTFEGFDIHGLASRGFSNLYDRGSGPIPVPGGLEVNSIGGPVTLMATVTRLPENLDADIPAQISFFAGLRNIFLSTTEVLPTIKIVNLTDGSDILPETEITGLNTGTDFETTSDWVEKSYEVNFSSSDLGDRIQVEWFGGGDNGGSGLLLADIRFVATATSETFFTTWENLSESGSLEQSYDMENWEVLKNSPSTFGEESITPGENNRVFIRWVPGE